MLVLLDSTELFNEATNQIKATVCIAIAKIKVAGTVFDKCQGSVVILDKLSMQVESEGHQGNFSNHHPK